MFLDIKKSRLQQVKTRQRRDLHLSFERKGITKILNLQIFLSKISPNLHFK